jgi:hypothetical protein
MKGDVIPPGDHVLRYASKTKAEDPGTAFRLKEGEPSLSVNWMEAFGGNAEQRVQHVRNNIHMKLGGEAWFFELNVGDALAYISTYAPTASVIEDPTDPEPPDYPHPDPSHALICNLPAHGTSEAAIVGEMLAEKIRLPHRAKPKAPGQ